MSSAPVCAAIMYIHIIRTLEINQLLEYYETKCQTKPPTQKPLDEEHVIKRHLNSYSQHGEDTLLLICFS